MVLYAAVLEKVTYGETKHERVLAGSNDNVYGRPAVTCFY